MSESLETKIRESGNPVNFLRNGPASRFKFPYPDQHGNWQDEQRAWVESAVLFDQSHHMTDVYFKGPDVQRLLSDTGTNSFATFGRDKAKHFVACNPRGQIIGTAVLFGLDDDEVSLVGPAAAANWLQFQAETGAYDVEVVRDERTADQRGGQRLTYRYEIEGPNAWKILERAAGRRVPPVKFFNMTELEIGGHTVRALSHTMAGLPGAQSMGLELFGPIEFKEAFLEAILAAGEEFGLVRGGALAYYTGSVESGYMAQPTPAVYTGEDLRPYREWLDAAGYEGSLSIGGSFASDDIEDYYVTPWEFGYEHLVKFDHDFIGRTALEERAKEPAKRKVWLRWNDEDVLAIHASSLFGRDDRAKFLETPLARYARVMADAVYSGDRRVGISTLAGYSVNFGAWSSVAVVDAEDAEDGAELTLVWGEENGGTAKLTVERHTQREIRAVVCVAPPHR
jgi:vanillate/3-O-methylgallate O-demethylase